MEKMMVRVIAISLMGLSAALAGGVSVESGEGNSKGSISEDNPGFISAAEEQLSVAAAAVAGVAQDAKKAAEGGWGHGKMPRELICDSYGRCKHKLSGAFSKAKHLVTETAQDFEEGVKEAAEAAANKAKVIASKATHATQVGAGKAKQTGEHLADKAKEEITSDSATSSITMKLLDPFTGMIHLLGFATAYGMAMWVTFGMSHVLRRTLHREQFAVVQSGVYPLYFKAMASSLGLALMGHSIWHRNSHATVSTRLQEYNLVGLIALVLANLVYLEPQASKAMFERMKIEKEEGRGVSVQATRLRQESETEADTSLTAPQTGKDDIETKMEKLRTRLRKLNSYSSLLNVITLMGMTWHLLYLSQRLCRK